MSALCPHCEKPVTYVKCYSIDIESSGAIRQNDSPALKAKMALVAAKGERALAELA
jgi:hypothetical protein